MRKVICFLAMLGMVSSAYAVEIFPLTYGDGTNMYANARGLTIAGDGTVFVAGATKDSAAAQRAAYWTLSGGVLGAPTFLPTNTGGSGASQANGIGLLADGTLVVGANMSSGAADWTSAAGQANNGWVVRTAGASQATVAGQANQITIQTGGTRYWNLGKTSNGATGYRYDVDGTAPRTDVNLVSWSMRLGGPGTYTSNAVQGVTPSGLAVGELRDITATVRRAYVSSSGSAILLPGITGRTDGNGQGYGISEDGNTVVGLALYSDADTVAGPAYWTNAAGVWSSHKLGRVPGASSVAVGYAVDQDGRFVVGRDFVAGRGEIGTFWDTQKMGGDGNPVATELKAWLVAQGVDMSGWAELGRLYSARTVNGQTYIIGDGTPAGTTLTRGFLVVIPEPATMLLLGLGGFALLRRR